MTRLVIMWNFTRFQVTLLLFSSAHYLLRHVAVNVAPSVSCLFLYVSLLVTTASLATRSSAIAEGPRNASCQLKSCQLPRNNAETTCTTTRTTTTTTV